MEELGEILLQQYIECILSLPIFYLHTFLQLLVFKVTPLSADDAPYSEQFSGVYKRAWFRDHIRHSRCVASIPSFMQ